MSNQARLEALKVASNTTSETDPKKIVAEAEIFLHYIVSGQLPKGGVSLNISGGSKRKKASTTPKKGR